jgi:hypothetical protein
LPYALKGGSQRLTRFGKKEPDSFSQIASRSLEMQTSIAKNNEAGKSDS